MTGFDAIFDSVMKSYKDAMVEQLNKPIFFHVSGPGSLNNRPLWSRSPFSVCPLLTDMWDQVHVKPLPMTVSKLIHKLHQFPPDMIVYTQDSDYGSEEITRIYQYEWLDNVVMLE